MFRLTLYQESPRLLPSSVIQHTVIIMALTSHSQGYKARSAKDKAHGAPHKFWRVLSMESHRTCSTAPAVNGDNTWEMLPTKKILRDLAPKVLLVAGHVGRLGQAPTKIPSSQKEGRCWAQAILFAKNSLAQWVIITSSGKAGSKIPVPRCQPRFNYVGRRPF